MYLDRNTVKKLEQLKTEAEAKIQTQRNEILKHIGIDSKFMSASNHSIETL